MPRLTRVGVVTDRGPVGPWAERAGLGGLRHLVRRLRWSLRSHDFAPESEAALLDRMSAAETALYRRLTVVDRHHAVHNAAHCIDAGLGDELVVAAALHDVGKLEAGLGTSGRVRRVAAQPGRRPRAGRVVAWAFGDARAGRFLCVTPRAGCGHARRDRFGSRGHRVGPGPPPTPRRGRSRAVGGPRFVAGRSGLTGPRQAGSSPTAVRTRSATGAAMERALPAPTARRRRVSAGSLSSSAKRA